MFRSTPFMQVIFLEEVLVVVVIKQWRQQEVAPTQPNRPPR